MNKSDTTSLKLLRSKEIEESLGIGRSNMNFLDCDFFIPNSNKRYKIVIFFLYLNLGKRL